MLESTKPLRQEISETTDVAQPDLVWREGVDFALVMSKLRHHRAAIVRAAAVGAFLCAALGALYLSVRARTYSASSDLLISNTTVQLSGPDAVVTPVMIENSVIQDEIELLRSGRVLDRVLQRVGERAAADMLPKGGALHALAAMARLTSAGAPSPAGSENLHDYLLTALKSDIAVARVNTSQVIRVTAKAASANGSARLADEIVDAALHDQTQANALVSTSAAMRERIKVVGPTLRVITAATPPRRVDGPPGALVLAISLFAGTLLGAGLGACWALLDKRVVSAEQLAIVAPLEFLGDLPRLRGSARGERTVAEATPSAQPVRLERFAAVLRRARLAALERPGEPPRFIGVTSCLPGEGKTTIAKAMAELFASESCRVLLIDAAADPWLTRRLAQDHRGGLREVLRRRVALAEVVRPEIAPFVDLLPAGSYDGDFDERWPELSQLIADSTSYHWVILDLPPLSSIADVRAAAQAAQDLLLVLRWRRTREDLVRRALRSLGPARDNLLGAVINHAPDHGPREAAGARPRRRRSRLLPAWMKEIRHARKEPRPSRTARAAFELVMKWACLAVLFTFILTTNAFADYKLGVSDRLKIKVQEWPDLGGEYVVNASGVVSLPLIGDVQAAGLDVGDVSREISDRLERRAKGVERPIAAVEVAQYRPFFIVGDVQHPGQYPFQPGLTVLQAIALAGGYYRPQDHGPLRLERDVVLAKGEIETQSLRLLHLLARAARLEAAVDDKAEISFPAEVTAARKDPQIAAAMDQERAALSLERREAAREAADLVATRTLYQNAIVTMQGQIGALGREQDSMKRHLAQLQSLSTRGLALAPTEYSLEREIAQSVDEQLNVRTQIVTSNENILEAEQKAKELSLKRSRTDNRDLQRARDEIADARARIATAYKLIGEAHSTALAAVRDSVTDQLSRSSIELIRNEGGKPRDIESDEGAAVEPGDTIKVPPPGLHASKNVVSQAEPPLMTLQ